MGFLVLAGLHGKLRVWVQDHSNPTTNRDAVHVLLNLPELACLESTESVCSGWRRIFTGH
jgi:hypothetical protein